MLDMPGCPKIDGCICRYPYGCVCPADEKALRAWKSGSLETEMTPAQRKWCSDEIASVEGYTREGHDTATDSELASEVLVAWTDYCRDKGLL